MTGGIAENVPLKAESTGARELLSSLLRMTTVVLVKVAKEPSESSSNKSLNDKNKENKVMNGLLYVSSSSVGGILF